MSLTSRSKITGPLAFIPGLASDRARRLGRRAAAALAFPIAFGLVACSDDSDYSTPPSSEVGTISGTVRQTGGSGIGGVAVSLSGPVQRNTTTSSSGSYGFSGLEPGNYTVTIAPPAGYSLPQGASATKSATVVAGGTVTVNFDLESENGGGGGGVDAVIINLAGASFSPNVVTIDRGQTVRWVYVSGGPHTVTPDGHSEWASVSMNQSGQTFEHVFYNSGEYRYLCQPHAGAGMTGRVVVQ